MPTYYKNSKGFEIDVPDLGGDGIRLPVGSYYVEGTFYAPYTTGINKCLVEITDENEIEYIEDNPESVIYVYPIVIGQLVTVPVPATPNSPGEEGQIAINIIDLEEGTGNIYIYMGGVWIQASDTTADWGE